MNGTGEDEGDGAEAYRWVKEVYFHDSQREVTIDAGVISG